MVELQYAREEAQVWQRNTRIQYPKLEKVSEEHHDLYQRQKVLERDNANLRSLSEQQRADLQGLWRQEEHAAELIRNLSPQHGENVRFVQSLRDELKEAEHECFELHRINKELRHGLRQCDGDRVRLEAHNKV